MYAAWNNSDETRAEWQGQGRRQLRLAAARCQTAGSELELEHLLSLPAGMTYAQAEALLLAAGYTDQHHWELVATTNLQVLAASTALLELRQEAGRVPGSSQWRLDRPEELAARTEPLQLTIPGAPPHSG